MWLLNTFLTLLYWKVSNSFQYIQGDYSFGAGEAECANQNGHHLATILTVSDNKEAIGLCTAGEPCRFGYSDPTNTGQGWEFSSGLKKAYDGWAVGQGEQHQNGNEDGYCADYYQNAWHDWSCELHGDILCDTDPITDINDIRWTTIPTMPFKTSNHRGFYSSFDKSLYLVGRSPNPWRLDVVTLTWYQDDRLGNIDQSVAITHQSAVEINNIYYINGDDADTLSHTSTTKIIKFDPITPTWEPNWVTNIGEAKGKCFTGNGVDTIYVIEPSDGTGGGAFYKIDINDPTNIVHGTSHSTDYSGTYNSFACGYKNGNVFIFGGNVNWFFKIDVVTDFATATWSKTGFAQPVRMGEVVLIGNLFWGASWYGGGGRWLTCTDVTNDTPQTNLVIADPQVPPGQRSFAAVIFSKYDNRLYVIGGQSPDSYVFSNKMLPITEAEVVTQNQPDTELICSRDAITFDWDELTAGGIGKPDVTFTINVDESPQTDLSLNIEVRVPYIVRASADDQLNANFGTTYVLDFEDFDAHKSSIAQPNSCSNRVESDYNGNSTSSRFEILSDDFNAIGTSDNMCYPPTDGTGWEIVKDESDCNSILYKGKWTWGELRECRNNGNALTDGGVQQTSIDNQDPNYLQLFGTLYVNMISPFWYEDYANKNMDFYRVYQLISQPFVIQISKSVYVIGKTGINVMTMSIVAVYKEDQDEDYILILLTEAAEYMELTNGQIIDVPQSTQFTLAMQSTSESNGCLNNKAYLCSQLWKIYTTQQTCTNNRDEINTNGGIDFSGDYRLRFTPQCRDGIGGYESLTHCDNWLKAHPIYKNDNDHSNNEQNGVVLSSHLTFVDGICEAKTFTIQLEATMNFYENPDYTGYIDPQTSSHLYQVGEDTVYGEIILNFPTDTEDIFDSELINVWLCTFPPGTDPLPPNQNGPDINVPTHDATNGGCFSNKRDGFKEGEGDEFFFHVYGENIAEEDFIVNQNGNEGNDVIHFQFTVPHEIQRDTLYVHAQLEVSLEELPRRRLLLDINIKPTGATTNKIAHFGKNIGITNKKGNEPKKPQIPPQEPISPIKPIQQPPLTQPFTISLNSTWIIIIGALLSIILLCNIIFMCYMNCCKGNNGRGVAISFNKNRRSGYRSVKNIDSEEFDISDANIINM